MRNTITLAFAIICVCAITSFAQLPISTPDRSNVPTYAKKAQEGPQIAPGAVDRLPGNRVRAGMPTERILSEEEREMMRTAEEDNRIKFGPSRDYYLEFQDFLNANRGAAAIERIFEFNNCGTGKVVSLTEIQRCASMPQLREGGSYVSFRCKDEMYIECASRRIADLKFKDGSFQVGDGVVQGIMANLGDVSIDSVTASHPATKYIANYDFKQSLDKIAGQDKTLASGIGADGYRFSNRAAVNLNSTYVLRSVLYRYAEPGHFFLPRRGSDIRVVIRVVGVEPDGSAVILVKELGREYPRRQIK